MPSTSITLTSQGGLEICGEDCPPLRGKVSLQALGRQLPLRRMKDGAYAAPALRLVLTPQAVPEGSILVMQLHVEKARTIDFCGVEVGPMRLTERHRFFGYRQGFSDKEGVRPALAAQQEHDSATLCGLVAGPDGSSWLAGMAMVCGDPSAFSLIKDRLQAGYQPARVLSPGTYVFSLFFGFDRNPLALLQTYGKFLAPLGRSAVGIPTGWNSWDFYGGAISMADADSEMTALEDLSCRSQLKYFTLDMGWEETWGSWTPNRKFPASLDAVAGRIRRAGWRPGIWTAPLQVGAFTTLARDRQDLFLRNAKGGLIVAESPIGQVLLLDFSLPAVCDLVASWYGAMRKAGFELFKLDYLYEAYLRHAVTCAGGLGKIAFARRIFETVRKAVGEKAHLINCCGPYTAALGLADSSRISLDIHTFWGYIRNNSRQLATSFWMNRRLWINDPDFALARHAGNCEVPFRNMPFEGAHLTDKPPYWALGPEASAAELRLWLGAVRLNGGSLFLSDSIRALSRAGRRDLERLFPPLDEPFVPLDLFERERPGVWWSPDRKRPTLGLFNWEDEARSIPLPSALAGPLRGREFWSGRRVRVADAVELGPRSGLLLEL